MQPLAVPLHQDRSAKFAQLRVVQVQQLLDQHGTILRPQLRFASNCIILVFEGLTTHEGRLYTDLDTDREDAKAVATVDDVICPEGEVKQ